MSNSQDKEFEQFLAGESPVSQLYKKNPDASPSAELDERILHQAHKAVAHHHSYAPFSGRWVVPASFAAVIVLSISIILQLPYNTEISPETVTTLGTQQKEAAAGDSRDAVRLDRFSIEKRQSEYSDAKPLPAPAPESAPAETPAAELKRKKAESSRPAVTKQAAPLRENFQPPAESLPRAAQQPAAAEIMAEPVVPEAMEAAPASSPAADTGIAKEEEPPALAEPVEESPALLDDIRAEQASPPLMEQDAELSEQDHWLIKIQKLLEENDTEKARSEYASFRKKYPGFHSHVTVEIEEKLGTSQ